MAILTNVFKTGEKFLEKVKPNSFFKTAETQVVDRVSTIKTGIPQIVKSAGSGALAVGLVGAGVGGAGYLAGKGLGVALEEVGFKQQTTADMIKENADAMNKYADSMQNLQNKFGGSLDLSTIFGNYGNPFNYDNSQLNNDRSSNGNKDSDDNTTITEKIRNVAIVVGIFALAGAFVWAGTKLGGNK